MTGYESKRAAAQAKTIDEVNWADHEPDGLSHLAQEPVVFNTLTSLRHKKTVGPIESAMRNIASAQPAQVYQDHDDALTIAYQSGYYDGKKAAQPAQEPINVRAKFLSENIVESIDCGDAAGAKATLEMLTALAQPAQEPFGYFRYDARLDAWVQNCGNNQGTPFYTTPPQRKPLNKEPPPWWPAVENILNEYGLQAVDFVADFKNALAQPEQEPVANDRALQLVTHQLNHWVAYATELRERLNKYEGGAPMLLNKEKNT